MRTRIFIIFLLASLLLISCNSLSTQNSPPVGAGQTESKADTDNLYGIVTSTADENESHDYSFPEPPETITDEIREDALKTYLETDKNTYGWNDTVKFRIITVSETAYITYGHGFDIEAWDEEKGEWVKANADHAEWTEEGCIGVGGGSDKFLISARVKEGYKKYRVANEISVDGVFLTAYSNEFTIE
ncbi:MAG: hypothetical protein IKC06_07380 [Clostridia bacterium]|nr:hypothetical protein [Clostridia bacterium]